MLAPEHLVAITDWFDSWNGGDPELLTQHLGDDFVLESDSLTAPIRGQQAVAQLVAIWRRAFPDLHFHVEDVAASEQRVAAEWMATGTHRGPLRDIPPTGRPVLLLGCTVFRFVGNRLVHGRAYWDAHTMRKQLGLAAEVEREVAPERHANGGGRAGPPAADALPPPP
jgi:steroid delta-isomerase-like uncharacterized protein